MPLEITNLTHIYSPGTVYEKKALDDINLRINDGEFVGLIGHTGSGKSTLIQHMNGLLKPFSGTVMLDGEDINADKNKLKAVRQQVGLVFQYPEHQLFEMTIFKDVSFGPTNMGLPQDEINRRVAHALEIVGIDPSMYETSPFELSGGQKRRVAIAGVLAMQPKVLILDEPTAGLDPKGRDEILDRISDLHKRLGITVILVSHSMEDVARYVQRVIVMHDSHVALDGTPAEVFVHADRLEAMGLASPTVVYLMSGLKALGWDLPQDVFTVDHAYNTLLALLGGDHD